MRQAMVRPMSLADMPGSLKVAFKMMRTPGLGWMMISVANIYITKMLPDLTHAELTPEALAAYGEPYPTVASRKAIRQWPCEVPLDGAPAGNAAVVLGYRKWLTQTEVPKLLFYGNNGVAIKAPELAWCREELSNLEVIELGDGIHFLQETHPEAIGIGLSSWFGRL